MECLFQLVKSLNPHWDPADGLGLIGISTAERWPTLCQRDAGERSGETNTVRMLEN